MTKRKLKGGGIKMESPIGDYLITWRTHLHYLELNDWIWWEMINSVGKSGYAHLTDDTLSATEEWKPNVVLTGIEAV